MCESKSKPRHGKLIRAALTAPSVRQKASHAMETWRDMLAGSEKLIRWLIWV